MPVLSKNHQVVVYEEGKGYNDSLDYILATNVSATLNNSYSPRKVFKRSSQPLVPVNSAAQSLTLSISFYIEINNIGNVLGGFKNILPNLPIISRSQDVDISLLKKKYVIRIGTGYFTGYLNTYQVDLQHGKPVVMTVDFLCDAPNYDSTINIDPSINSWMSDRDSFKYNICYSKDCYVSHPSFESPLSITAKYSINRTPIFKIGEYGIGDTLIDSCEASAEIINASPIRFEKAIRNGNLYTVAVVIGNGFLSQALLQNSNVTFANAIVFRINTSHIESKQITLPQDNIVGTQTSFKQFLV